MFDPTGRTRGIVLAAAAAVAMIGCDDPGQNTDLRPGGPPEVLSVLVANDPSAQLYESATFCKTGDDKRPTLVDLPDATQQQICDDDASKPASEVTDAYPDGWYVRVVFDELLDGDIEELVPIIDPDTGEDSGTSAGSIKNTHPVELKCMSSTGGGMVDVPYDGYYSPAGNAITWPLGPSIVIKPDDPRTIATTSACTVTLNANIVDKSGNPVPADERGPFTFTVAPLVPIAISVDDDPDGESPIDALSIYSDNVFVQFNTEVDPASWCDEGVGMDECEFEFVPDDAASNVGTCAISSGICNSGGPACPAGVMDTCDVAVVYNYNAAAVIGGGVLTSSGVTEWGFGTTTPQMTGAAYKFQFKQGTKIADRCGVETTFGAPSAGDLTLANFTTAAFDVSGTTPGDGDTVGAIRKPVIQFNNALDLTSLAPTEYAIAPAPELASVVSSAGNNGDLKFAGNYKPGTMYTLTLNAGATVNDAHGATYTNDEALVVNFMTAAIAVTATSPANNGTKIKATTASFTNIDIAFNQAMNPTTLDPATEVSLTGPTASTFGAATALGCTPASTSCTLRLTTAVSLEPGSYTFTLKQGATISDVLATPTVYTQAADRVVKFKVANAAAPATPLVCL